MDTNQLDSRFDSDNEAFENQFQNLNILVKSFVRDISLKQFDLKESDIGRVHSALEEHRYRMDYLQYILTRRVFNLKRIDDIEANATLIPLGSNCVPRTLLAKYGLIRSRSQGRLTLPFDLSIHQLSAVAKLLQADFAPYMDPSAYRQLPSGFPALTTMPGVVFNHDEHVVKDGNFAALVEVNKRRANNFHEYARRENRYFVVNARTVDLDSIDSLLDVLRVKYNNPKTILIVSFEFDVSAYPWVHKIYAPEPFTGYNFSIVDHYATKAGRGYEASIIDAVERIVLGDGLRSI